MMHLIHPDVVHSIVRDHMEHLRAHPDPWREIRQPSVLRRAIGAMLIHLGERVGGQQVRPVLPPASTKLATP